VLHKFQQPIGEETYEIRTTSEGVGADIRFSFTDRGEKVPLTAKFLGLSDLTPVSLEVEGKYCRQAEIHRGVEVGGAAIRVRDRAVWTERTRPDAFFTIAGYAPVTLQALLLSYWASHGQPTELPIFPEGSVRVLHRGRESVTLGNGTSTVDRYSVDGLIWGRETVWIASDRSLVAVVTLDAEYDRFEAIREGYEVGLDQFVRQAGADGMALMSELASRISGARPDTLAIVNGHLIDGTGRDPVDGATVLVHGGRIVAVGRSSEIVVPVGATVVDASGRSILPGLWDMHAHFQQVEWGPIYLAAGVTTVRDCANELEFIVAVRDAVAEGRGLGPRILTAGVVDGTGPYTVGVARVDDASQAEAWVSRYHAAGFQQMKLYSSLSLDSVRAVAEAAHRAGMTVTGHVPIGLDARQTIEAGQDQVNHVWSLASMFQDPLPPAATGAERLRAFAELDLDTPRARQALDFLRTHGTVIDPTLALSELSTVSVSNPPTGFEPGAAKVPRELGVRLSSLGPRTPETEARERVFRKAVALVGALHRAGVTIVAGTDQAVPGHSLHREIELYADAGFTPMEALQAATIVPARVMGLERDSGSIEVGKRADLILVRGDPLARIRNIRNVEKVVALGHVYNCADLWRSVGFAP
jgi:imidazolonepropionase-like amidohydrolase